MYGNKIFYIFKTPEQHENAGRRQRHIFGVIFDEEAAGYTTINTSLDPSPYNARGRYYNLWYRFHDRWWLDLTENFVVLLLD